MVVKLYLINVSAQQYSYWRVEMCMITSINNVKQISPTGGKYSV